MKEYPSSVPPRSAFVVSSKELQGSRDGLKALYRPDFLASVDMFCPQAPKAFNSTGENHPNVSEFYHSLCPVRHTFREALHVGARKNIIHARVDGRCLGQVLISSTALKGALERLCAVNVWRPSLT